MMSDPTVGSAIIAAMVQQWEYGTMATQRKNGKNEKNGNGNGQPENTNQVVTYVPISEVSNEDLLAIAKRNLKRAEKNIRVSTVLREVDDTGEKIITMTSPLNFPLNTRIGEMAFATTADKERIKTSVKARKANTKGELPTPEFASFGKATLTGYAPELLPIKS